jgi:hypothetical protein
MRRTDGSDTRGRSDDNFPEDVQLPALTPTSRIKERLRHSVQRQVALGGDLVSQIELETAGRVPERPGSEYLNLGAEEAMISPPVSLSSLPSDISPLTGLTPRVSPFTVYVTGSGSGFWEIVRDHGWPDHKIGELRKLFMAYSSKGRQASDAESDGTESADAASDDAWTLSYGGFEKLLPELLEGDVLQARTRRYWTYLDTGRKGEVDFEDFFIWFLKYMHTDLDRSNPDSPFASKWMPAPPAAERTPRMQLHNRKFSKNVERTPSSALGESSVKSLASRRTVDF